MNEISDEVNRAIVLYLGRGIAATPQHDHERLIATFGKDKAELLTAKVDELLEESLAIEIDSSKHSLISAGQEVERVMRDRHPKLSKPALDAIDWHFTWCNR